MKYLVLFRKMVIIFCGLLNISSTYAGTPMWTFQPLTATSFNIPANGSETVRYLVTNRASEIRTLELRPIPGITQITTPGNCPNPFILGYQQSCILNLFINGSQLVSDVNGGPVVCDHGNANQCYQPSYPNRLDIRKGPKEFYTLGGTVTGLAGTLILANGSQTVTINANGPYTFPNPLPPNSFYQVTVQSQPALQTCIVSNGTGQTMRSDVTNVNVACMTTSTVLTPSLNELALSADNLTNGPAGPPVASGNARTITVTNSGTITATNVNVTPTTSPGGSWSLTTNCTGNLPAGASCIITVTPTSVPTNNCNNGSVPPPDIIQITSNDAATVSTNILVISYACIYQGGYVFSIDDSGPFNTSIKGKVVTTAAIATVRWDADPTCGVFPFVCTIQTNAWEFNIGLDAASVPGSTNPGGAGTNGPGNTFLISAMLNGNNGDTNGPPATYAAGACVSYTGSGFTNWYLPAICEMGYSIGATQGNCGTNNTPTLQNIQSTVVDFNPGLITLEHWSSTENSLFNPGGDAFAQLFNNTGGFQADLAKTNPFLIRCARPF